VKPSVEIVEIFRKSRRETPGLSFTVSLDSSVFGLPSSIHNLRAVCGLKKLDSMRVFRLADLDVRSRRSVSPSAAKNYTTAKRIAAMPGVSHLRGKQNKPSCVGKPNCRLARNGVVLRIYLTMFAILTLLPNLTGTVHGSSLTRK
jgi:hypothetical protein